MRLGGLRGHSSREGWVHQERRRSFAMFKEGWHGQGLLSIYSKVIGNLREILGFNFRRGPQPNLIDGLSLAPETFGQKIFMLQVNRDRGKLKDSLASRCHKLLSILRDNNIMASGGRRTKLYAKYHPAWRALGFRLKLTNPAGSVVICEGKEV